MSNPITGPILLPSKPALKADSPFMLDWGGALTPQNGGAVQTLMRLGTRNGLDFTLPQMRTEPLGREWSAKLRLAKLFGALLPFGQDGFNIGTPGTPVIDGAGQSGMVAAMRGFTPGYVVKLGQAFSLVHLNRRYLHFAAVTAIVDTGGRISLPIFPMLRLFPNDGDACEFATPMIQGSLSGNQVKWNRQSAPWTDVGTITITEDE